MDNIKTDFNTNFRDIIMEEVWVNSDFDNNMRYKSANNIHINIETNIRNNIWTNIRNNLWDSIYAII